MFEDFPYEPRYAQSHALIALSASKFVSCTKSFLVIAMFSQVKVSLSDIDVQNYVASYLSYTGVIHSMVFIWREVHLHGSKDSDFCKVFYYSVVWLMHFCAGYSAIKVWTIP